MSMFRVVERFVSINGEGAAAGELAVFLRFAGCDLQCSYCDTAWANRPDVPVTLYTAEELADWAESTGIHNVLLTGGEPLLQPEIGTLIGKLGEKGHRVEIETNGSVPLAPFAACVPRPVFTMDYKLPGSGMEHAMLTENFRYLQPQDAVKFVCGSREDLERARRILRQFSLDKLCHVFFSPVFGSIEPVEIVQFMMEHRMDHVRVQLQLHKYIWHPDTRGV